MRSALHPTAFKIIVPCHNCEAYIGECLDSLLAQDFTGWTALVADDCSTDGTAEAVRPYLADPRIRLRVGPERRHLMGNTLDALRSLELKPSDVLAILDGDDLIYPGCLGKLWEAHCSGFDLVYTDEDIQYQDHSVGRALLPGVPPRRQLWCFSQLRSFKAYLFSLLPDETFRDASGRYFRAAGDLSLYLPMAELAGPDKIRFIDERLYFYRVHDRCNFKVFRQEQLDNNWLIRNRPPLGQQVEHFDFTVQVTELDKARLFELAADIRARYPRPYTVRLLHAVRPEQVDSWRAYHNLWIESGVYLQGVVSAGEGQP